jgi:hypothetical protein
MFCSSLAFGCFAIAIKTPYKGFDKLKKTKNQRVGFILIKPGILPNGQWTINIDA